MDLIHLKHLPFVDLPTFSSYTALTPRRREENGSNIDKRGNVIKFYNIFVVGGRHKVLANSNSQFTTVHELQAGLLFGK